MWRLAHDDHGLGATAQVLNGPDRASNPAQLDRRPVRGPSAFGAAAAPVQLIPVDGDQIDIGGHQRRASPSACTDPGLRQ